MEILKNYINGEWVVSASDQSIDVVNPALQEVMAKVPYGQDTKKDVAMATESASKAFKEWRNVPVMKRVQVLYQLKSLIEQNLDTLAEAYYQNTEYAKALSIIEKALDRDTKNLDYFKKQKKKFEKALRKQKKKEDLNRSIQ